MDSTDRKSTLSVILLLLSITGCLRATDNMISSTVPLLGTYVFASGTVYGGIFSAIYSGSASFSTLIINPRLSGRARRPIFLAAIAMFGATVALLSVTNSVATLLCGVVAGMTIGMVYSNIASSAAGYASRYRSEWPISVYSLGLGVGLVTGPIIETYLLAMGYGVVFLVFGLITLVALVLSFQVRISYVARRPGEMSSLARRGYSQGMLTGAIFAVPFAAISVFLPVYAKDAFQISTTLAYSSLIPMYVVSLVVRSIMSVKPPRRMVPPIVVSIMITIAALAGIFLAPTFAVFLIIVCLFGIPHAAMYTLSLVLVSRTSSSEEIYTMNSRLTAGYNFISMIVPVAIGAVAEAIGIRSSFLLLLLPICLLSLFLFKSLRRGSDSAYLTEWSWKD